MTHLNTAALQALLERVEAGDWWANLPRPDILHTDLCWKAFNGSLDAAKALHDAVLPGWIYLIGSQIAGVSMSDHEDPRWWNMMHDGNPARGWLIAIIRALAAPVAENEAACDATAVQPQ